MDSGKPDHQQFENQVLRYFGGITDKGFEQAFCIFCNLDQDRVQLFTKGSMIIVRCKCGFVYNAHQPTQAVLSEFYERSDAMTSWADIKSSDKEKQRQLEKFGDAVDFIAGQPLIESVLDLGCGNGVFLSLVKEKRPDIHLLGTDTSEPALTVAKKNGVPTFQASISNVLSRSIAFDCITLWGVLEHVKAPITVLKQVYHGLSDLGYIIVCVPNVGSEVVKALWKECYTFTPPHLWYFDTNNLEDALIRTGFTLVKDYTIEPEALPLLRHSEGLKPYNLEPDWMSNRMVGAGIISQSILKKKRGYKIVAIAQKTTTPQGQVA